MNAVAEAKQALKAALERLGQLECSVSLPQQEYTIPQAFEKLRAALGHGALVSIDPPAISWYSVDSEPTVGEWAVYEDRSKKTYTSKTLAGAVNACLAANTPAPRDPVADVQAQLELVTAPAF